MLVSDLYQRYRLVEELIFTKRSNSNGIQILEVGGLEGFSKLFLKKNTVILNLNQGDVIGSGLSLPFKDNSFDVAVSLDTLEHIPENQRETFIREIVRVGGETVVIGAPFKDPSIVRAEKLVNKFHYLLFNTDEPNLAEHRTMGLPVRSILENALKELKLKYKVYVNGYLQRWVVYMKLRLVLFRIPIIRFLRFPDKLFNIIYNLVFYRIDNSPPSYRQVYIIRKRSKAEIA